MNKSAKKWIDMSRMTFEGVAVIENEGFGKVTLEFPTPPRVELPDTWFVQMRQLLEDGGIHPRDHDELIDDLLLKNEELVTVRALVACIKRG